MKVIQINAVPYGSTGRIMFQLADAISNNGGLVLCTSGFTWKKSNRKDYFMTGSIISKTWHIIMAKLTGRIGCFSIIATRRLINKIEQFSPDIVHLHNLHGWFINIPMLFKFLKKRRIPIVWTMHDCWAFTGHCPHYQMAGCDKWKTGCYDCPQYKNYPGTFRDYSKIMYQKKASWFAEYPNITIVTPSDWLHSQVGQSYLKDYTIRTINNGIDLSIFCKGESDIKSRYSVENKRIILGVSFAWDEKKGLDVFIALSHCLNDKYQIILVGTDEKVDKELPDNIISIHRTDSQHELANLYRAADVFVNPTREDTFPTVNMEAMACGTPVITFDVGGSPEIIDSDSGIVVPKNDINAMEEAIYRICENSIAYNTGCLERAKKYDQQLSIDEYIKLYSEII